MRDTDKVDCRKMFPISEVDESRGHRFRLKGKRF